MRTATRSTRSGAWASIASAGVLRALPTSVDTPEPPAAHGAPPAADAMISVSSHGLPSARTPPSESTTTSPAFGAGICPGRARDHAPSSALASSFTRLVRALTAAGNAGSTMLPGRVATVRGTRLPSLQAACGASVRAKYATAACTAPRDALTGPVVWSAQALRSSSAPLPRLRMHTDTRTGSG